MRQGRGVDSSLALHVPGPGLDLQDVLTRVDSNSDSPQRTELSRALRGTETLLLVEDQDNVRNVAHDILSASSPSEALVLCEQHHGAIDLLLTDVVMPQLSGVELAKRVAQARPELKVLYMTGYADDSIVRHGMLEGEMAFLQKPFTPESLTTKVRDTLDGGHGSRAVGPRT